MTRGIRNNNPLNIRHSKYNDWKGMCELQTDSQFVQFVDRVWGYRAAFRVIRNYIKFRNANTIGKIILRWAPPGDRNDTPAYVKFVCETTGIKGNEPIRFDDQRTMVALVKSMAQMESGIIEDNAVLDKAYCLSLS